MIWIFFQQDGQARFCEISPATDEQLRSYRFKNGTTIQQVVDQVRNQFGSVSEDLIVQYLNSATSSR